MYSAYCYCTDAPGPPGYLRIYKIGFTWIFLTWIPPAYQGLPKIKSYTVKAINTETNTEYGMITDPDKVSLNYTGLISGFTYKFYVYAVTGTFFITRTGSSSNVVSGTTMKVCKYKQKSLKNQSGQAISCYNRCICPGHV